MSHLKEREEKNCLNCNAQLQGKYCHVCGQENTEPRESVWHLLNHVFQDITHFDGKFFSSLKYLISRPGFLSREYVNGRRASYLNPVRMYVFSSAFFFLIFFSFFKMNGDQMTQGAAINGKTLKQAEAMDSAAFSAYTRKINREEDKPDIAMSQQQFKRYYDSVIDNAAGGLQLTSTKYRSKAEYDSLLKAGVKKHNWLQRKLIYKQIGLNEKYKGRGREAFAAAGEAFVHRLPQMLFISLPLLALLLKLMYIRSKDFYYVSHAVFGIHLYIFIFIVMLCSLSLGKINDSLHWGAISFLKAVLVLAVFLYLYKSMRNFYQQRRLRTLLKFLLLNISFLMIMGALFVFFIVFSLFSI